MGWAGGSAVLVASLLFFGGHAIISSMFLDRGCATPDAVEDEDEEEEGDAEGDADGGDETGRRLVFWCFDFESCVFFGSSVLLDGLGERFDLLDECFLCLGFSVLLSGGVARTGTWTWLWAPLLCSCRSSSFIACNASSSEPLRSVSEAHVEMSAVSINTFLDIPAFLA